MTAGTSFAFATAGRILFGAGRAAELPALAAGLGRRPLVCTGGHPARHGDLITALEAAVASGAGAVAVYPVPGEPTVDILREAVVAARDHGADVVVAVGGGSVIDVAKAVAVLLGNAGDPLEYLEVVGAGRPLDRPGAPCVAVPTTAGTGAEVTANSVLAVPEHRVKVSLRSSLMLPRVALVDPALTMGCPPPVTAASGLDALTQCLEPLVSVMANPMTDALAREGLRHAGAALRRAYADGADLDARTAMSLCSVFGGLALANAKLGAVHGLSGAVGGMVNVPHGMACAALLAPVVEVNIRALRTRHPDSPALGRYAEAARLLTGRPDADLADGVAWIRQTVTMLGVPGLASFGLRRQDLPAAAAAAARASSTQGNPVVLDTDELLEALAEAL